MFAVSIKCSKNSTIKVTERIDASTKQSIKFQTHYDFIGELNSE